MSKFKYPVVNSANLPPAIKDVQKRLGALLNTCTSTVTGEQRESLEHVRDYDEQTIIAFAVFLNDPDGFMKAAATFALAPEMYAQAISKEIDAILAGTFKLLGKDGSGAVNGDTQSQDALDTPASELVGSSR